jgi:hypothetical protein
MSAHARHGESRRHVESGATRATITGCSAELSSGWDEGVTFPVSQVFALCDNGNSAPSFIDDEGVFHHGGVTAPAIQCP